MGGSGLAFDWWPGILGWLLVLELIGLGVMLAYRWIAGLVGKNDPTDFFVIFHRVFWRAMARPSRYPLPVDYQPVPPRRDKRKGDEPAEGEGQLSEEELENLLGGNLPPPSVVATYDGDGSGLTPPTGDDDGAVGTGGVSQLKVRVDGPAAGEEVRGFEGETLVIAVKVAPDDGRANAAAIGTVARVLRLQTHQVAISAGHTRPDKTLRITGLSDAELAARRDDLAAAATPGPAAAEDDPFADDDEPGVGFRDD